LITPSPRPTRQNHFCSEFTKTPCKISCLVQTTLEWRQLALISSTGKQ
jgi:hypothetical protein